MDIPVGRIFCRKAGNKQSNNKPIPN